MPQQSMNNTTLCCDVTYNIIQSLCIIYIGGESNPDLPCNFIQNLCIIYNIDQNVKYKIREDLKFYKSKEIESTFLEIIENNLKDVITGCIYKHPGAAIQEFTNDFICLLLEKLLTEKKEVILMGDYNINIINSDVDNQTSDFLDTMCSISFFPTKHPNSHLIHLEL